LKKNEENVKVREDNRLRMKEKMKEFYENRKKLIREGQQNAEVGTSDLFGGLKMGME